MNRSLWLVATALIVGSLAGCGSTPPAGPVVAPPAAPSAPSSAPPSVGAGDPIAAAASAANARANTLGGRSTASAFPPATGTPGAASPGASYTFPDDTAPLPAPLQQGKSRWQPVRWAELPGFADDTLFEGWNAWLKSCERPGRTFAEMCREVRGLSIASPTEQRDWMVKRLQPYRVEPLNGAATDGLLTSYFEPELDARRQPDATHTVPLYRVPASLGGRRPWYTRQEMETLPEALAALRGREIAYLADPVDALILQIQGSGRLRITEASPYRRHEEHFIFEPVKQQYDRWSNKQHVRQFKR